jgi:hypothetical protein
VDWVRAAYADVFAEGKRQLAVRLARTRHIDDVSDGKPTGDTDVSDFGG